MHRSTFSGNIAVQGEDGEDTTIDPHESSGEQFDVSRDDAIGVLTMSKKADKIHMVFWTTLNLHTTAETEDLSIDAFVADPTDVST